MSRWRTKHELIIYTTDGGEHHVEAGVLLEEDEPEYQVMCPPDWIAVAISDTGGLVHEDDVTEVP